MNLRMTCFGGQAKRGLLLMMVLLISPLAQAKPMDADLAIHSVDIDHDFQGIDILLFGARNDVGQIAVVVRGPEKRYIVRKKERIMGVWANRQYVEFEHVPASYNLASTIPISELHNQNLLAALEIGTDNLPFRATNSNLTEGTIAAFRQALIDEKQDDLLYSRTIYPVEFWGETLFRTELPFSKNIGRGWYTAEVYLINDGTLSAMQSTPIEVRKIGIEAFIHDMAFTHPWFYGLVAVLMAIGSGWSASRLFGRIR